MNLIVNNGTKYLNDYYFQTLCLLYFPGEKFPKKKPEEDSAVNAVVDFFGEPGNFTCRVKIDAANRIGAGEFCSRGYEFSVPLSESDEAQAVAGRAFLIAGEQIFGFLPPWGCITGLRPAKRVRFFFDKGNSYENIRNLYIKDYLVSPEKAEMSIKTAQKEIEMLKKVPEKRCGLYVSIPFCPTRCEYCSFVSYSNRKLFSLIPDYLDRLDGDIKAVCRIIKELGLELSAVYIGGGTPSILDEKQTERLFAGISPAVFDGHNPEFTYESGRPDTTTREKLLIAKNYGVTRVSINPQSTNQQVLDNIGRKHSISQFFDAVETAKKVGFDCMNADLIAGLPGDTEETFKKSLNDVIKSEFENITVHTLSIKNASPIRFSAENIYDARGEFARKCVSYAYHTLENAGYGPYYFYRQKNTVGNAENTGYSKPGKEGLYNVLMMEEYSTVFACGAGAITKLVSPSGDVIERIAHPKYPFEYLEIDKGKTVGEEAIKSFYGRYCADEENRH